MLCAVRDISQLVTKLKQLIVDFWGLSGSEQRPSAWKPQEELLL